jgi:hypothetical protein
MVALNGTNKRGEYLAWTIAEYKIADLGAFTLVPWCTERMANG